MTSLILILVAVNVFLAGVLVMAWILWRREMRRRQRLAIEEALRNIATLDWMMNGTPLMDYIMHKEEK